MSQLNTTPSRGQMFKVRQNAQTPWNVLCSRSKDRFSLFQKIQSFFKFSLLYSILHTWSIMSCGLTVPLFLPRSSPFRPLAPQSPVPSFKLTQQARSFRIYPQSFFRPCNHEHRPSNIHLFYFSNDLRGLSHLFFISSLVFLTSLPSPLHACMLPYILRHT